MTFEKTPSIIPVARPFLIPDIRAVSSFDSYLCMHCKWWTGLNFVYFHIVSAQSTHFKVAFLEPLNAKTVLITVNTSSAIAPAPA